MSGPGPRLSPYLEALVKENMLLPREAQIISRLPEGLHEKAIALSEKERVVAIEKIVSDLLNPHVQVPPSTGKPFFWPLVKLALGAALIGGMLGIIFPEVLTPPPPAGFSVRISEFGALTFTMLEHGRPYAIMPYYRRAGEKRFTPFLEGPMPWSMEVFEVMPEASGKLEFALTYIDARGRESRYSSVHQLFVR